MSSNFEIPDKIEVYLATLSKLYANESQKKLQEILVNAKVTVREAWSSDNWNGGPYGHALFLQIPEAIYLSNVNHKTDIEKTIKEALNRLNNIQNEYIEEVFLEMEVKEDEDWRKESGLQVDKRRVLADSLVQRVWGAVGYRVFLSHKSEVKKETSELKEKLKYYGVVGFVAHEDIIPTKEWQTEIENALISMDAFVALMTEDFHDSNWTDQEVGFALGRGIPVISVRLGKDPYGFIGKFQALSCPWDSTAKGIMKILIKNDRVVDFYVKSVQSCPNFETGNAQAELLPAIDKLSLKQANELVTAFNENGQVRACFGFNGTKPNLFGAGLSYHLNRLTGQNYAIWKGKMENKS